MTIIENLPPELKEHGLFCTWRRQEVKGRMTKVPYNPKTGGKAQSNNPDTFAPLAVAEAVQGKYDGLGVGIFGNLCAVDIDHCIDDEGYSQMALDIIATMGSYTEVSPSGTGVRILFYATGLQYDKARFYINNPKLGLEVYVAGMTQKYVTVTGNTNMPGRAIEERADKLQIILDKYMQRKAPVTRPAARSVVPLSDDDALLAKAHKGKNGAAFAALWNGDISAYPSHSEADIALCNMLAFWCVKDFAMMDRMFRQSGLMRDKWDRPQSGTTYGAITIQKAIDDCSAIYDPKPRSFEPTDTVVARLPQGEYRQTDIGAGDLFADVYGDVVRYSATQGVYYLWDGKRWADDTRERINELAKELAAKKMPSMAGDIADDDKRTDWLKWAVKLQSNRVRAEMLKAARSKPQIAADINDFDSGSRYINLLNGVYDLKEGRLLPHDKALMLSKMAAAAYNPSARCERWDSFLLEIMDGDRDMARFAQKAVGYAMCGKPLDDCLFILYGEKTRNGKSTFCRSILHALGDYGCSAQPETLAVNRNRTGSGPSSDIARLRGARLVNLAEPGKSMELDGALVKTLTGRDPITTRFMHRDFFEFIPQFVLFMNTNYLPRIDDMTLFQSGRIFCIPFNRHFPPAQQDRNLLDLFTEPEAASAIFNWMLEGYTMYQAEGLRNKVPAAISAATQEYNESSDTFGSFLRDCVSQCENDWTSTSDIYRAYEEWTRENGHRPMSTKSLSMEMKRRGYAARLHPSTRRAGFGDITLTNDLPEGWRRVS